MPEASLVIELGKQAKDYVRVLGKNTKYKRSGVTLKVQGSFVQIRIEADDTVALVASLSSAVKSLGIVASVDSLINKGRKDKVKE